MTKKNDLQVIKNKPLNLNTKKGRQISLDIKIKEIDDRLKELGVGNLKYKTNGSINNPETGQNTVNITTSSDFSLLLRMLSYFKTCQQTRTNFIKESQLTKIPVLLNNQALLVQDIIFDIELRLHMLSNSAEINTLTQIKDQLLPFMNEESRFISALKNVDNLLKQ